MLVPRGLFVISGLFGGLGFGDGYRAVGFAAHCSARSALHPLANDLSHWLIDGAGVRFLLANTELGQHVDDSVRGDLQLPCELIDSNFTHK